MKARRRFPRGGRARSWLAASAPARRAAGLHPAKEIALIVAVYGAYSIVRNWFGSAAVAPAVAARNADRIIDIQRAIGLDIEASVQDAVIDATAFIQFWNLFYGVAHFLVTFAVLVWMYLAHPSDYRFWRRAGLAATTSALVGFAVFPLMPPRLLGSCGPYGACRPESPFIDTVRDVGGIWSFESDGMEAISNQYAAMPSLHIGWALWCALLLAPRVRPMWARVMAALYPVLTLYAIVVTANHWWLDGVGGVAVVALGWAFSAGWERRARRGSVATKPPSSAADGPRIGTTVASGDSASRPAPD